MASGLSSPCVSEMTPIVMSELSGWAREIMNREKTLCRQNEDQSHEREAQCQNTDDESPSKNDLYGSDLLGEIIE